jgi:hypothetical protein
MTTPDQMTAMLVALGRIEENQKASYLRLANVETKLDGQPTRREFEEARKADQARIKSLEDSRSWIIKAVIGAWLAGVSFIYAVARKVGMV